jgi:thiol-disulfide isomerase/thioredoxin
MSLPSKSALAAIAALAVALPVASAGPKPAPAGKSPAAAPVGASFAAIEEAADQAEKDSNLALRRRRYDAVAAYVKAKPDAADIAEARLSAMNLAEEIEEWAKVVAHADEYVAKHAEGEGKSDASFTRAGALVKLKKNDDAKKAYTELIDGLDMAKVGPQVCWNVRSTYATFLADIGDIEGAKAAYQDAKDKMKDIGGVEQAAEIALKGLDRLGKEPDALPEDAKDLDGKVVTWADYKGKVLLVDFWATWCGPCRAEMPNIIKAFEKFHAKGFEVLGVSLDRPGDGDKLKKYITDKKMPWRQIYYPEDRNKVAEAFEVNGIPYTMLIGKDGKIVKTNLRGEALQKTLEELFK